MKFLEKQIINNSRTTHALFRVNGVSINSLEMENKRRLSLSSLPEAQGLLNVLKRHTTVSYDRRKIKVLARYLLSYCRLLAISQ